MSELFPFVGLPESLIRTESGGSFTAQNNVAGAGGSGHFGRGQFSRARLQDAQRAGVIPQGTTPEQFLADPSMQQRVEQWHVADIGRQISAAGLDQYIGQEINGVPVTPEGMVAVAHLGGFGGLQRFLESGGAYNPSDAYGTSLQSYLGTHGQAAGAGGGQPVNALAAQVGGQQNPWTAGMDQNALASIIGDQTGRDGTQGFNALARLNQQNPAGDQPYMLDPRDFMSQGYGQQQPVQQNQQPVGQRYATRYLGSNRS